MDREPEETAACSSRPLPSRCSNAPRSSSHSVRPTAATGSTCRPCKHSYLLVWVSLSKPGQRDEREQGSTPFARIELAVCGSQYHPEYKVYDRLTRELCTWQAQTGHLAKQCKGSILTLVARAGQPSRQQSANTLRAAAVM